MSMVTRKDLESYVHVRREVRLLREELSGDDFMVADTVSGSTENFPYVERTFTISGVNERRRERLQRRLERKEAICDRVEEFVDSIEDSEMHNLIKLRFLKGLSWPRVMRWMDCRLSPEAARMKVERFLQRNF